MSPTNILQVYNQATEHDKIEGLRWYKEALLFCQELASIYGISEIVAVGVVVALSPTNRWENNKIQAEQLIDLYVNGGNLDDFKPSTYPVMRDKAIEIITKNRSVKTIQKTLNGPKVIEFFNSILQLDDCTIDGHAYNIWAGSYTTLKKVPGIGVKIRRKIKSDYRVIAKGENIPVRDLQAITWCTWRRINNVV